MDKRAEQYLEYSIEQKNLMKRKSHRWFLQGMFGTIYDSNIILALDEQLNQPNVNLDVEGLRFITSNTLKYRPFFEEKNEMSIEVGATLVQTLGTDFSVDDELQKADPWVFSIGLPLTHRGLLWKKGYSFDLRPSFETLVMDLSGTGKEPVINSILLDFNNTIVGSRNFVLKADFQLRNDSADVGGSSNADAMRYTFALKSIVVLNKDSERYLIPALSYAVNDAKGSDFAFSRLDLGLTFTSAIFGRLVWTNNLNYFVANYRSPRVDKNYSLTTGLNYALGLKWNIALTGNYQINDSNTNRFKKLQVMSTVAYSF